MTTRDRDTSLGMGVYFSPDDYVGITRRIVILGIDLAVLITVYVLFAVLLIPIAGERSGSVGLLYIGFVWAYLTVLKSSRLRTVGYRLMGARIINLRGRRPSMLRMTFRLLLWMFGPFNLLFDLLWSSFDDDHQTLRDRFAGTCVVNSQADPVGTAEIQLKYYYAFGFALMYSRVMRPLHVD
ncbi:MAG: RDD family protein [Leptolyngbya sp. SIO3F4]|nr:RDD family protein [Leptolyngbya sp. SIO3F4]